MITVFLIGRITKTNISLNEMLANASKRMLNPRGLPFFFNAGAISNIIGGECHGYSPTKICAVGDVRLAAEKTFIDSIEDINNGINDKRFNQLSTICFYNGDSQIDSANILVYNIHNNLSKKLIGTMGKGRKIVIAEMAEGVSDQTKYISECFKSDDVCIISNDKLKLSSSLLTQEIDNVILSTNVETINA